MVRSERKFQDGVARGKYEYANYAGKDQVVLDYRPPEDFRFRLCFCWDSKMSFIQLCDLLCQWAVFLGMVFCPRCMWEFGVSPEHAMHYHLLLYIAVLCYFTRIIYLFFRNGYSHLLCGQRRAAEILEKQEAGDRILETQGVSGVLEASKRRSRGWY